MDFGGNSAANCLEHRYWEIGFPNRMHQQEIDG